jgi:hypothetical protein
MVLLDDTVYKETKKIALGKAKRKPILIELSDWLLQSYSVKVLNIDFNKLISSKSGRYRLCIILENTKDYQKMYVRNFEPNEEYQNEIANEFRRLARKYQFATEEQLRDLWVTYIDFSEEAKTEANWKAAKEVEDSLRKKYSVVWDVIPMFSGSVVFYYSDFDIAINESKGISKLITDDYYAILKKYDELNYFTRDNISLKFDSKENLDKNYAGSFFYYSR